MELLNHTENKSQFLLNIKQKPRFKRGVYSYPGRFMLHNKIKKKQQLRGRSEKEGDVAAATGRGSCCCANELSCWVCNYCYWKVCRDLPALEKEKKKKKKKWKNPQRRVFTSRQFVLHDITQRDMSIVGPP